MHPSELFKRIHRSGGYRHIGKHLSYKFHKIRKDRTIYVCFQGSNGMTDWLHNLLTIPNRMEPVDGCGWFVHAGFARVWRSGRDTVMAELEKVMRVQPKGFKVVFAGFSHGGPLAMLAAQQWNQRTGEKCQCVTFGSPKLAWAAEARRVLNESMILTNWINPADIVTTVPLHRWGFRHVREDIVKVRAIPVVSKLRVSKHHQIYDRPEIYPTNWRRS